MENSNLEKANDLRISFKKYVVAVGITYGENSSYYRVLSSVVSYLEKNLGSCVKGCDENTRSKLEKIVSKLMDKEEVIKIVKLDERVLKELTNALMPYFLQNNNYSRKR